VLLTEKLGARAAPRSAGSSGCPPITSDWIECACAAL